MKSNFFEIFICLVVGFGFSFFVLLAGGSIAYAIIEPSVELSPMVVTDPFDTSTSTITPLYTQTVLPTPTPTPTTVVTVVTPTISIKTNADIAADIDSRTDIELPSKIIYTKIVDTTVTPTTTIVPDGVDRFLETYPTVKRFSYINDHSTYRFSMVMYRGVYDYLSEKDRYIYVDGGESYKKFIDDDVQDTYMSDLMDYVVSTSNDPDTQAYNAIRFVQNIPYDDDNVEKHYTVRYPYQVLYDGKGICADKSVLIVYILANLGYDTAYIQFEEDNHAIAGVKCDDRYEYKGTGYCFIESTTPLMVTYSDLEYGYNGLLESPPMVIHMSDGKKLNDIEDEWVDANRFSELTRKSIDSDGMLSPDDYHDWLNIATKYGINIG